MANVIGQEAAEQELGRIVQFFEVDPEGEDWQDAKARLMAAIMKGRIILDEQKGVVIMSLVSPIELETGEVIKDLTFREPTAGDLKALDKYKDNEKMGKTIALAAKITGQIPAIIDRMGTRDVATMGAITTLFF